MKLLEREAKLEARKGSPTMSFYNAVIQLAG